MVCNIYVPICLKLWVGLSGRFQIAQAREERQCKYLPTIRKNNNLIKEGDLKIIIIKIEGLISK